MSAAAPQSPLGDAHQLEVELTNHCVTRFHERIRPCLLRRQAEEELLRLLEASGEVAFDRPAWLGWQPDDPADAWVLLGPSVVIPLKLDGGVFVALTVLSRGHTSRTTSIRRRKARRRNRSRR